MLPQEYKRKIIEEAEAVQEQVFAVSRAIHQHPELGNQEFFAAQLLSSTLEAQGFHLTPGVGGVPTAFRGEYTRHPQGPRIAFLAEYDALPEMGHACGHNLIGAASLGAGLVVRRVLGDLPGSVVVLGTPAEETNGAKIALAGAGVFDDIDAALMFHPGNCNAIEIYSLALEALEFTFWGQSAHTIAQNQTRGINALDGVLHFFQGLRQMQQSLGNAAYIHGIISEGGISPNIVPEKAVARFYLRAQQPEQLARVVERVQKTAQEAAQITGTQVTWRNYELSYAPLLTNPTLAYLFRENLQSLGITNLTGPCLAQGSLDLGSISHRIPCLHPYLVLRPDVTPHTWEFARAAGGVEGEKVLQLAIKALALTALDLYYNPALMERAKQELRRKTIAL